MRSKLKHFLPSPLYQLAVRVKSRLRPDTAEREAARLAALPPARLHATSLARADELDLRRAFRHPQVDDEWAAIAIELEGLGVTTRAGGVNPGDRRALYYLARYLDVANVLEVGTHIGASTIHLAVALRTRRRTGGAVVGLTTVDIHDVNDPRLKPWERYGSDHSPAEMLRRLGCDEFVDFATESSSTFLARTQAKYDLIFLDGDHSAATVYQEVPLALRALKPGGYILLHDYFPDGMPLWKGGELVPGPYLAVERLRAEGAPIEVIPLGALPWPTKLGSTVTSLALLGHA